MDGNAADRLMIGGRRLALCVLFASFFLRVNNQLHTRDNFVIFIDDHDVMGALTGQLGDLL